MIMKILGQIIIQFGSKTSLQTSAHTLIRNETTRKELVDLEKAF